MIGSFGAHVQGGCPAAVVSPPPHRPQLRPSTCRRQVTNLERELGVTLIERSPPTVGLTKTAVSCCVTPKTCSARPPGSSTSSTALTARRRHRSPPRQLLCRVDVIPSAGGRGVCAPNTRRSRARGCGRSSPSWRYGPFERSSRPLAVAYRFDPLDDGLGRLHLFDDPYVVTFTRSPRWRAEPRLPPLRAARGPSAG